MEIEIYGGSASLDEQGGDGAIVLSDQSYAGMAGSHRERGHGGSYNRKIMAHLIEADMGANDFVCD